MERTAASRLAARLTGARALVVALWAGSLWAVGYLAAPAVFAVVGSPIAGSVVGKMLTREAWLSMACAAILLVLLRMAPELDAKRKRLLNRLVLAMLALTLVNYFGLQPLISAMRGSGDRTTFLVMHGVSQLVFVIESVLAAVLVVKNR
ncbi:MAG TPA: DUF4149 domain-containing protein [Telluria sp.]